MLNFITKNIKRSVLLGGIFLFLTPHVLASESSMEATSHGGGIALLWIGLLLLVAKLSSSIEKFGQPSVLGELLAGVLIGNLALLGTHTFDPIKTSSEIKFLAEVGVIILLFQVGLESNLRQIVKVGKTSFIVATVGVVTPFALGTYVVGPWLFPALSFGAHLFLGATLTATSVGITARVFKDLKQTQLPEAQIVLGAAVIDDVMGLIILAVVSAIVTVGSLSFGSISLIVGKAFLFLAGSILLGQLLAPHFAKLFSKIQQGLSTKLAFALIILFVYAYLAEIVGLAPIVGAFAAGLVLDPTDFRYFKGSRLSREIEEEIGSLKGETRKKFMALIKKYNHKHIEHLVDAVSFLFVPLFFVYTGINVNLEVLFNPKVLFLAIVITIVAFVGKYVSGLFAGKVNKTIVGIGMVPRGEVGLIFATIGKSLGVVNEEIFSVIVVMVILTTIMTPPMLTHFLKKKESVNSKLSLNKI